MSTIVTPSDYHIRFSGIQRLFGALAQQRLREAHVCVIGVGGVGSWTVEALARTGVGKLTLIDLDEVCVSNVNRQLPALTEDVGKPKVQVLKTRIEAINPECEVTAREEFFTQLTAEEMLSCPYEYVVDAIDHVANKCLLIAECKKRNLPIITVGGAGGRRDPSAIKVSDLAFTTHDPLLQQVRKKLRAEFGFPAGIKTPFGLECVYSTEPQVFPRADGTVCAEREPGTELRLNCESGYGTATFVTGTFGFLAAARVVENLSQQPSK